MDELERPGQAASDNKSQREHADNPVEQYGVSRTRPTAALASKKPYSRAVPANRRWQHLIEIRCYKTELQRGRIRQTHTACGGNFSPAGGEQRDLSGQQEKGDTNPARFEPFQPVCQCADINPTQRKIEQQDGNCRLGQQQQRAAHRREILNAMNDDLGLAGRLRKALPTMQVWVPCKPPSAAPIDLRQARIIY